MKIRLLFILMKLIANGKITRQDAKDSEDLFRGREASLWEELGYQRCLALYLARKLRGESREKAKKLAEDVSASEIPLPDFFERFEPLYTETLLKL